MLDNFIEFEYKYRADGILLTDFKELIETTNGTTGTLDISSWDCYFSKNEADFLRFRQGNLPELTKKVKFHTDNNWKRLECDLPLDAKRVTKEIVAKFAEMEGYKKDFEIYKSCFIYWTESVNYVYYIVYDTNLTELGRFIEVEINKNSVKDTSFSNLSKILEVEEAKLHKLGLGPKDRISSSLFELYSKHRN